MSEPDRLEHAMKTMRFNGYQMERVRHIGLLRHDFLHVAYPMSFTVYTQAIEANDLGEVLRYSYYMLRELRTAPLAPQLYYALFTEAVERLRPLEAYFTELGTGNMEYTTLYERVQHCGAVLPRLYLMCTVGGAYLRTADAEAKFVMRYVDASHIFAKCWEFPCIALELTMLWPSPNPAHLIWVGHQTV